MQFVDLGIVFAEWRQSFGGWNAVDAHKTDGHSRRANATRILLNRVFSTHRAGLFAVVIAGQKF